MNSAERKATLESGYKKKKTAGRQYAQRTGKQEGNNAYREFMV
jgi:hypothetical protein